MKQIRNEKGFSLVEMALALMVMMILAGVIYLATETLRADSRTRAAANQLETLSLALVQYEAKNVGFPTALNQTGFLAYLPQRPDTATWSYVCDTTSSRIAWQAPDDAIATAVGSEWAKTLSAANVIVTPKAGTTPPSVTGIFKTGANCITTP